MPIANRFFHPLKMEDKDKKKFLLKTGVCFNPYKHSILFTGCRQIWQILIGQRKMWCLIMIFTGQRKMWCLIMIFTVCLQNVLIKFEKKKEKNTTQHPNNWK